MIEKQKNKGGRKVIHGMYGTPVYNSWIRMKHRCNNRNNPAFHHYGGRGIVVCDEWNRFENFYADMGSTYKDGLTLDRVDNNGNYCKENCRWATVTQQQNNKRNNLYLTHNGKTQSLRLWCTELDLTYSKIHTRVYRMKWSDKDALTIP